MKRCILVSLVFVFIAASFSLHAIAGGQDAAPAADQSRAAEEQHQTVAERSGYLATSRSAEVVELLEAIAEEAPHVSRLNFGRTVEGRPLTMAVAARPHVTSPEGLQHDDRLVVLLLGNIHAGECAGKEALLALLRDLALGVNDTWLDHLVLLVVPNYNADGNDRVGKHHRPGQLGPEEGMGLRHNAQGLDLNRDFMKLDAPETRALVQLINDWNPHVLIDTHTTNGSRHRYALTYDVPHNPASPRTIRNYLRETMMPEVTRRLEEKDLDTFFYGNFNREHTRWSTFGHEPRYSTEYMGLRGRLAILSEAYSYIPYEDRIRATRLFVDECLTFLSENHQQVAVLVDDVDERATAAGESKMGEAIPVRAKIAAFADKVVVRGYVEPSSGDGMDTDASPDAGALVDGGKAADGGVSSGTDASPRPKDYEVEYFGRFEPAADVERAFAYLLPFDESRVADRLRMHGLVIEQLKEDVALDVEIYKIDELERSEQSFQRHRMVTLEVTKRSEQVDVSEGTYVIRTAQPLGTLAAYLLEPAADDGLAAWNFFDHELEAARDYPVLRVADPRELPTRVVETIVAAGQLDLDQIYGPERKVPLGGTSSTSIAWLPGQTKYVRRIGGRVVRVDAKTGAVETLFDSPRAGEALARLPAIAADDARQAAKQDGELSPDGRSVLLSLADDLFLYRSDDDRAVRLTDSPSEERFATFSPDGRLVAFVRDHNLYVVEVDTGRQRALSTDGNGEILCAELDWVYQEEIYGRGEYRAFWWSPDSSRIAYLRLDETPVRSYTVTDHIPYRQTLEVTRYPKAGDPLPGVSLGIVRAAGGSAQFVEHYEYGSGEFLIVRVGWTADGGQVIYQVQNRAQTWLDLRSADPASGESKRMLREESPAWVEVLGHPHWLDDGSFLWLSQRSGQRHIYHVPKDGGEPRPVTRGPWDVLSLYGTDAEERFVYFRARKDSITRAGCYRIQLDGSGLEQISDPARYHRARFDESCSYFVDYASDIHSPPHVRLCRADGKVLRFVEPNLNDYLPYYRLSRPELLEVSARDGTPLEAMLIKPPDFDPTKKYPILCYVYGGPQAPLVQDRWSGSTYLWHQMLAQRGFVIWLCDNRSASARGIEQTWPIHGDLGRLELSDVEDGVKWLCRQPWVDPERIGIWGWSYGGYVTSYALTHSELFKIGIAGAPVTDWRNYDAVYTERYMGLPQDNPDGYETSSVVAAADKLNGRLLLIHGATDDNVHLANTLQLTYALQTAGKQFELMIYPKNRHGIRDPKQLRHLRELMTQFVLENL